MWTEARTGPLSPFQEVYWHADRHAPGTFATIFRAFEVAGPLHLPALAASLRTLVARHGALRTRFAPGPVQVVETAVPAPLRVIRSRAEDERIGAELLAPFDLGAAPLLRLTVLRRAPDEHILLLAVHHIICDGLSLRILLAELGDEYAARRIGRPPPAAAPAASYLEFVAWQRRESQSRLDAARKHWRRVLNPRPRPVDLVPRRSQSVDSYRQARRPFRLGGGSAQHLAEASRRLRVTPFIALLAGFKVVLWAWSGTADVAVGSLFAVRVRAEFEATVGLLANATVLRTSLAGDPTFRELTSRLRAVVLDAADHQTVPIEAAAPAEDLRPAWSVWFTMLPAPTDELRIDGACVRPRDPQPLAPYVKTAPAWEGDNLAATTWLAAGEVRGHLDYNRRLLDPAAVDRLAAAYRSVTMHGLADPDLRLSDLRALSDGAVP
jgi:hypothetical protein